MSLDAEKRRAYNAAYYTANREKIRVSSAAYYITNHAEVCVSRAKWRKANREKHAARNIVWQKANPEKHNASCKVHIQAYPEKHRVRCAAWKKSHLHKGRAYAAKRNALKLQAIPAWADVDLMHDMYAEAAYQGMELDHMVPLNSLKVCGLHWEGNFQLLTVQENTSKGNRHWPDMWPS